MTDYRALCAELFKACETLYKQSVTASHHQTITLSNGEHPIPISSDMLAQDAVFGDLLHRTRAALAKSDGPAVPESREPASVVGESIDDVELDELFTEIDQSGEALSWRAYARAVLSRWGHQPAPHDNRGVLPMIISDTGASEEPERERIICASISGGADYVNNMPRTLTLERIELHKDSTCGITGRRYIQEPTPPAEGEVAELVARLRTYANVEQAEGRPAIGRSLSRAAELLQQQHPTPVPVSQRLPGDQLCWWYEPDEEDGYGGSGGMWILLRIRGDTGAYTHWLPAHALPLPSGEVK